MINLRQSAIGNWQSAIGNRQSATVNNLPRRSPFIIATLALLAFSFQGLRAQSNSEYSFRQQNNLSNLSTNGQITLNAVTDQILTLGQGVSLWSIYGKNNIELGSSTVPNYIYAPTTNTTTDEISNNYWDGNDPNLITSQFPNVSFTSASFLSSPTSTSGIVCGSLGDLARKSHPFTQSYDTTRCKDIPELGQELAHDGYYDAAFDTAQYFINHGCYNMPGANQIFGVLGACNGRATPLEGSAGELFYRNYLISILYLNLTDPWYCADVSEIVHSFGDYQKAISLTKFLLDNPRCSDPSVGYSYWLMRRLEYKNWVDTVSVDTTKYPFDTTLLTLHQMGLDTLLYNASVPIKGTVPHQIITAANITINPFSRLSGISFDLSQMAYVRLEVYDKLGRMVQGDGNGHVMAQGSQTLSFESADWPSGTYYARLSTANGEVRTLKLVKNE